MNLTREEIQQTILDGLTMCNQARPEGEQIPVATDTEIFGPAGHVDSMGLVSLLLDIEDALLEKDIEISLNDERAMSAKNSPFRSVASLTDYIMEQLEAL
jgi:acyl carrier protein